jgi:hypothetical protein
VIYAPRMRKERPIAGTPRTSRSRSFVPSMTHSFVSKNARSGVPIIPPSCMPSSLWTASSCHTFQRDVAIQLRIMRAIHLAHAAHADLGGDFVDAEAAVGGKGQEEAP